MVTELSSEVKELRKEFRVFQQSCRCCQPVGVVGQLVALADGVEMPIRSLEEFDHAEASLQTPEACKAMVTRLLVVGGTSLESRVRRVLSLVLTNEVASALNWAGKKMKEEQKQKRAFKHTKICKCIYDNYKTARERAKRAIDTSNIESEDNSSRRTKQPKRFRESDDEIQDTHEDSQQMSDLSDAAVEQPRLDGGDIAELRELIGQTERRLLLAMEKMKEDIGNSVQRLLQVMQLQQPPAANSQLDAINEPCTTVAELEALKLALEEPEKRKKTTQYLSLMGGSSPSDTVRRILRRIATNNVWETYSLKGRKGKTPFIGTTLHCVVLNALTQQLGASMDDYAFGQAVQKWLRYAPDRDGGTGRGGAS
ncbi:hypothetical protein ACEWY4_001317 [Coilia grayii]|uniref:DUF4806 domain-containing protein n=1 Tax=Coilia grayii TaxID=363190 RepID=A0ABD1KSK7_9TELE